MSGVGLVRNLKHGSQAVLGMTPAKTLLPFGRLGIGSLVFH